MALLIGTKCGGGGVEEGGGGCSMPSKNLIDSVAI
jgi:hypothetical protein